MLPPPVCVWLKRDLRVTDQAALATAVKRCRGGGVLAVFLYEPEILGQPEWHASHTAFQQECLAAVEPALARLGVRLITRRGEAVAMLEHLRQETNFVELFAHEETGTAVSYARDRRVRRWARQAGVRFVEQPQTGVVRRLASRNGWNRLWEGRMESPQEEVRPVASGRNSAMLNQLSTAGLLGPQELGQPIEQGSRQSGGEQAAAEVLNDFLTRRGRFYAGGISSPLTAETACSRLSAHLAFGSISIRRVWQASEARRLEVKAAVASTTDRRERFQLQAWQRSLKAMQSRLHWHCHFMQKLEDEPAIEQANMWRAADGLREDEFSPERFAAWTAGQTGYPLVDACIRSLVATGWLNFRMRALLVSFASYSLWLHWRQTGLFLAKHFLDFEPGIHWSQMQMQSGTTGINTLRIYNPDKQAIEQDPHGMFIRRWLPELAGVPDDYIHQPWTMPQSVQQAAGCLIGRDYQEPIVDHTVALREARARFTVLRHDPNARAEARDVADRHGSRRDRRGDMQQDPVRRQLAGRRSPGRSRQRLVDSSQRTFSFLADDEEG